MTVGHGPSRATPAERDRLLADFVRLCELPSPSRDERAVADVVAGELRACGLEVEEDDSAAATGSNAGNLLARIPGPRGAPTVLFAAHLDTVPPTAPIEVVEQEGRLTNRHEGVLGADNKAAVAALLGVARRFGAAGASAVVGAGSDIPPTELASQCSSGGMSLPARSSTPGGTIDGAPVGIELLFTTCEEVALLGAKELTHELRSGFGFVFDHATPIGDLIVAAPSYYRIDAHFHGAAAHAGIRPEAGHNAIAAAAEAVAAMSLGRIDEETTANVGTIRGGTATNVVAERCHVALEARSLDEEKAGAAVTDIVDCLTEAATDFECDVETTVEQLFRAYRLPRSSAPVQAACAALESLAIEPNPISTGGGSDANVLVARGMPVLNVANGTERNHEPDESVSVDALVAGLDVALAIVAHSAAAAAG